MLDTITALDITIFHFINGTLSNPFFDFIMPILTNQNNWTIPLLLGLIWLVTYGGKRGRITAGVLVLAFILSDVLSAQLLKPLVGRIRPSHTLTDSINLLVKKGGKFSFPSNHASNSMVLAVVIGYFWRPVLPYLFGLSILIGFTRVYVGVHYPFDVVAGWVFGYTIAWGVLSLWVIVKMREIKRGSLWVWYEGDPPDYSG